MSAAGIEKARIARTETVNKYVGAEIRKRRAALGMTHGDLAARVGMSKPSVSLIEAGRRSLSVARLIVFAAALGANPCDLLPPAEVPGA